MTVCIQNQLKKKLTTYKEAGVDVTAGEEAVQRIKKHVRSTFNAQVLTDLGGFGGCFEFPQNKFKNPVLISSADGVGTKLKLAFLSDKHDSIGQCLVNHCVNDILVVGAKPLFFLDYFAIGKLDISVFESVVSGLSKACRENGCALIGGETAEMPGFYQKGEYDISGTIIGVAEKEYMLPNRNTNTGDILIGLPSTGLHTNGYSLARKVLLEHYDVDEFVPELGCTVGEELLNIHKSYLQIIEPILKEDWLHGLAHVTGGGIEGNTKRIIDNGQKLKIEWSSWERLPVFNLIQKLGNVPEDDIRQSMNLGIGLILIISPDAITSLQNHLDACQEPYYILGNVV